MVIMNVVLLGAPGVGKGTTAERLSGRYSLPHISTGDVLRESIASKTSLGLKAKAFVDSGRLVPDKLVTEMVKARIAGNSKGFFLDGYPRNINQAEALKAFSEVDVVLNLSAPKKLVIERLSGRRICMKCNAIYHVKNIAPKKDNVCDKCGSELYQRSDETPDVITERLRVYDEDTKPLVDFYRNEGLLRDIDAAQDVDGVVKQCVEALERDD